MSEAKLAPNLPDWMVEHANRYLASGGTDGHMYKITVPQRGEITAPALLLTTTGRKSGDKFIFPLFYGTDGGSYFVVASKGGAPQHPGWYRNILANPDVEVQVGTKKMNARARTTAGEERLRLWKKGARILAALRRLSAQDRARDTGGRAGSSPLGYVAAGRRSDGVALVITLPASSAPMRTLSSDVCRQTGASRRSTRSPSRRGPTPMTTNGIIKA